MVAGIEGGQRFAGPIGARPLPGAKGVLPEPAAIGALQNHPRFQEAVRTAIDGLIETYAGNTLLNRVINDRGRAVGSAIALYLHYAPVPGRQETGLTVGRFQALCADSELCSPGRARALLALMRLAGYLAPESGGSDRRQRRLVPTEALIEAHRRRWKRQFEAMAFVMPEGRIALEILGRAEFTAAFLRHLGASYFAGFRLLHYAPDLARVVENNAGLLVVSSLFSSAAGGGMVAPNGTAVPISVSALSLRFGIARAHTRRLLADAAEAGLVRRADGSRTVVVVLPRLGHAVGGFFAALFVILAHCAKAVAQDLGVETPPRALARY